MKKQIIIEAEFPDNFVPPDKFDSAYDADYGGTGKCVECPFYSCDTYEPYDNCMCPSEDEKCPIKKYFE